MEQPILVYMKKADKSLNKITIPKAIVNQWGREFRMEIYQDRIVLIPLRKEQ